MWLACPTPATAHRPSPVNKRRFSGLLREETKKQGLGLGLSWFKAGLRNANVGPDRPTLYSKGPGKIPVVFLELLP